MKFLREFGGAFLALAVLQVIWVQVMTSPRDATNMMNGLVAPAFVPTVGLAVALVFLGHLMPARVGTERIQERAGQLGPSDKMLCAIGVLGGVSLTGGWGGPVGMGLAVVGVAIAAGRRKPAPASDAKVD